MRIKALSTFIVFLVAVSCSVYSFGKTTIAFHVSIVSIVEIPPIAELREGFKEVFVNSEFAKAHRIVIEELNAQGDPSLTNQIADKLATRMPDLAFVLGTPAAQAIQKRAPDLLLLQGAATDPIEAGLADSWNGSGRKYIATSDLPPIPRIVKLIEQLTPGVRKLGVIYNPGEANSAAVVKRLRAYLDSNSVNLQVIDGPIGSTVDVASVSESFIGRVDAIFLPPDNSAAAAMPVIGKVARENKIPFYATSSTVLEHGALAAVSLDFIELGRESARLAIEVLNGKDPKTTPIRLLDNPVIYINGKLAVELNVDVSKLTYDPNVIIR